MSIVEPESRSGSERLEVGALTFVSLSKGLGSGVGCHAALGAPGAVEFVLPVSVLGEALFFRITAERFSLHAIPVFGKNEPCGNIK
jgi:hypothetical protein